MYVCMTEVKRRSVSKTSGFTMQIPTWLYRGRDNLSLPQALRFFRVITIIFSYHVVYFMPPLNGLLLNLQNCSKRSYRKNKWLWPCEVKSSTRMIVSRSSGFALVMLQYSFCHCSSHHQSWKSVCLVSNNIFEKLWALIPGVLTVAQKTTGFFGARFPSTNRATSVDSHG